VCRVSCGWNEEKYLARVQGPKNQGTRGRSLCTLFPVAQVHTTYRFKKQSIVACQKGAGRLLLQRLSHSQPSPSISLRTGIELTALMGCAKTDRKKKRIGRFVQFVSSHSDTPRFQLSSVFPPLTAARVWAAQLPAWPCCPLLSATSATPLLGWPKAAQQSWSGHRLCVIHKGGNCTSHIPHCTALHSHHRCA
jgi:hypothetical protein